MRYYFCVKDFTLDYVLLHVFIYPVIGEILISFMVGKMNFVTTQNLAIECVSTPSYLKLIPYAKFKIFLQSSGPIRSVCIHTNKICISE